MEDNCLEEVATTVAPAIFELSGNFIQSPVLMHDATPPAIHTRHDPPHEITVGGQVLSLAQETVGSTASAHSSIEFAFRTLIFRFFCL